MPDDVVMPPLYEAELVVRAYTRARQSCTTLPLLLLLLLLLL
jgi:hypothetical protein